MNWLWTSADLVSAMAGRSFGTLPEGVKDISIDSRTVGSGEAFFAIKGDRVDGHNFASIAMANGASLLVVSEGKLPALGRLTIPMIVVEDVLAAMIKLGIAARDRTAAKIVAVTGSVGKTTTKEMLRDALSASGRVHASVASFNNHWGVPLTLARMPRDTDFGVFEIGMNHSGEIRPLVKMVRPHVAIITTIAPVHIGHFKDITEIAAAKAEIFEGVVPGGHVLLNRDNAQYKQLEKAAQAAEISHIHTFGSSAKADFRLIEASTGAQGSEVWAAIGGQTFEMPMEAPGRHVAENAMAVLGAASIVGADLDMAKMALSHFSPGKGRGQRHVLEASNGPFTVIDESYNANPASVRATLALLRDTQPGPGGRRIAVLGDMMELGETSAESHASLATPIAESGISEVWLAGADMAALRDALPETVTVEYRDNAVELADFAVKTVGSGDVLMIKASNSIGFGKIVQALLDKFPAFSDTERLS